MRAMSRGTMKSCSAMVGTNSQVGQAMSYRPVAPPWRRVRSSSFDG